MSLLLVLIPLIASAVLLLTRPAGARAIALAATVANLGLTIFMLSGFNPSTPGYVHEFDVPWIAEAGIHFHLGLDGISMLMVILSNLLSPLIVYSSFGKSYENEARYYGLITMMVGALNGVFMAIDGLAFYVFYELALIPIYFICAIWGGENRIRITLKFFIYTFIGSLFMLVAMLYVYLKTPGEHTFNWMQLMQTPLTAEASWWVMLGFFLAFAVKMPVFPFHTWQPDTYVSAPTGGTMLLSGIMLKMGVYGAIRWMIPLADESLHWWQPIFIGLAVTGIVYASIIAVKQSDLKRLIAYSSIAHVGLIAAGLLAWNQTGVQGAMIQMLSHGINVVGLFLVVDIIEKRIGSRSLSEMGGIAKSAPVFATLFMIIMLGAVAVPLTNGFPGEFLLLNGVWNYSNWAGAIAGLTIIFGAVYMLRAYGLAMFGPANEASSRFAPLQSNELLVLGAIAVLVIVLGFFPQAVLSLTEPAVKQLIEQPHF
ncbi:MAG: NADH-quinone oxidoreductase subunit M [Chitinophagales bacterium]|nr:NADH-quinone oxidoreductase subunit M [Chitinophagales bacterium]